MQIYKGFDIGTAKVSKKIREEVPHHLLDVLDLDQECSSSKYVKLATPIIDRLIKKGIVPIVVGGTHVYLKSLIWESMIDFSEGSDLNPSISDEKYSGISSTELYKQLSEIDPERASSLHYNDRRRIIRSIEICKKNNEKFSEICKKFPYKLRYKNCLLFWIRNSKIKDNIETRVNEMINEGLLEEAFMLKEKIVNCQKITGIIQGIAYKELKDILLRREKVEDISEEEISEFKCNLALKTLQYSKRQEKYIKKHLFRDVSVNTLVLNGGIGSNKTSVSNEFNIIREAVYKITKFIENCPCYRHNSNYNNTTINDSKKALFADSIFESAITEIEKRLPLARRYASGKRA